jgi:predicted ATPase/tetratricopeptide (TPR) repeat protein
VATRRGSTRATNEPARARTNLRAPASSFVGRGAELAAIERAFEGARLVTLQGPGGIGKTRLSLRHAEERLAALTRRGRGGVWIVDLADTRTGLEVLAAIADVLGLGLAGHATERAMSDAIGRAIARLGPTLLVLDNVEQVASFVARQLDPWLGSAPSARLLVTSRVALGIAAERVVIVPPLATADARTLFVERARAVRAMREAETEPALVDAIVAAIDRMPLAIELAASRTRVLSAPELKERLARPLEVLSGGTTHDRHASVREAVLGSLALLEPRARRAFAALSILDNGFTLELAEVLLAAIEPGRDALALLDTLARASLLVVELGAGAKVRHAFFETIREVAKEELAAHTRPGGPISLETLWSAHVAHHADLARRALADPGCVDPGGVEAGGVDPREHAERLAHELEHVLTARRHAARLGLIEPLVAITLALEPELSRRGLSALRDRIYGEAIEATKSAGQEPSRAAALHLGRGLARRELGEGDLAREDFEAALVHAQAAGDTGLSALARSRLGGIADLRGDTAGARALLSSALALLAQTPGGRVRDLREAEAHLRLGHALRREGALEPAHASFTRAASLHRSLGLDDGLAATLYELGVVEMFRERTDAAFARFDEGLRVARRAGVRIMEGACLTARGCLLQDLGRLGEALAHHAEAASVFRDHGSRYREASALYYLACTYLERGEATEAHEVLARARRAIEGVGAPRYDVLMSGGCALALAALARHDEAREELARARVAVASVPNEPALAVVLSIHARTLDHRVAATRDEARAEADLATSRAEVASSPSDDTRWALRELERALGRATVQARDALSIWGPGEAFQAPGAQRVALPSRSPMRRILDCLATHRERAAGEPVSLEALIQAGWPGEKIGADAALNRAYVAIAGLRKLGLRDVLVRSGGGYALSQAVVVRRMRSAVDSSGD